MSIDVLEGEKYTSARKAGVVLMGRIVTVVLLYTSLQG